MKDLTKYEANQVSGGQEGSGKCSFIDTYLRGYTSCRILNTSDGSVLTRKCKDVQPNGTAKCDFVDIVKNKSVQVGNSTIILPEGRNEWSADVDGYFLH
jgi:hypothetical protein